MNYELKQYPDGIYFDMPFKVYAGQNRLSTTAIGKLNKGPLVYYEDVIAPTLEDGYDAEAVIEEMTQSLAEGRAWHDMTIEGSAVFWQRNAKAFEQSEWEKEHKVKLLKMKDDYVDACKKHGLNEKGTMKVLKSQLKEAGADVLFLDEVKSNYEKSNEGKYLLTEKQLNEIERAGEISDQYGIRENWLFGGFPEVSILFTADGIKYKIRVDYLCPDMQVEYKTFANKYSKPIDEAVPAQIHDQGYLTGAFLYQEGVKKARGMLKDDLSCAHGLPETQESVDWIDEFISGGDGGKHKYWFLFQQRGKYNHMVARELPSHDNGRITSMYRTGQLRAMRAAKHYHWYMENNGLEKRWLPPLNPKAFDDSDFKPWQLEE